MKQFVILFALITPTLVFAGGKKTPPASLSFHIEGSAQEGPKFVRKVKTLAGEKHFRKSPEISTRDIIAFSPFPAEDKNTYGLILQLNKIAKRRLFTSTSTNRGKLLLTLMNGQAMGVVRVDLLGRMPSAVGYQPTLAEEMGALQERITSTKT